MASHRRVTPRKLGPGPRSTQPFEGTGFDPRAHGFPRHRCSPSARCGSSKASLAHGDSPRGVRQTARHKCARHIRPGRGAAALCIQCAVNTSGALCDQGHPPTAPAAAARRPPTGKTRLAPASPPPCNPSVREMTSLAPPRPGWCACDASTNSCVAADAAPAGSIRRPSVAQQCHIRVVPADITGPKNACAAPVNPPRTDQSRPAGPLRIVSIGSRTRLLAAEISCHHRPFTTINGAVTPIYSNTFHTEARPNQTCSIIPDEPRHQRHTPSAPFSSRCSLPTVDARADTRRPSP